MSVRKIIKEIGNPYINLYKDVGYWYFVYDDPANNLFETRSIMTPYLKNMSVEKWVEIGKDFVYEMENAE